ncbi:MAG: lipoamide acyltransferase component of branched-chain alpha-keto aciddehydrogenase complex [Osedax symbiont Rs1]|nr:MAG: lipoamide acyltransferase component of branched-chain alpha-keto aciddehydrogenase complex [Osedax symbiont Rs1]
MSQFSFKLPDLGEGIVASEIVEWHVKVGDTVSEDQHIVDVMTDKAVVEVTAPVSGVVAKLACEAGIEIPVGSELILFTLEENSQSAAQDERPPTPVAAPQAVSCLSTNDPVQVLSKTVLSSPSVRRHAREGNIDLSLVSGTGTAGRINNSDLQDFIDNGGQQVSKVAATCSTIDADFASKDIKISGLRRVIAKKMLQATHNIPHYSYIEEIDLTALDTLREHLNKHRKDDQQKLTLLPFIMQTLVKVIRDFPHCNAHYNAETEILTQYSAVDVGIATMTEQGLLVPVIKNTQQLDIWQSAAQLSKITAITRSGGAKAQQLTGSTITITSLGAIGGIATTPIINAPETTIIGINKMQLRPVVIDGKIVIRKMMNLSSSFDHRIVDGYDGALFIQALKTLLENPGAIFV